MFDSQDGDYSGIITLKYLLRTPMIRRVSLSAVSAVLFSSLFVGNGTADETRLELAARAFSRAADECLYDVRDRGFKYETSRNCNALGTLSMQFIEAGGFKDDVPDSIALIAQKGLTTAWMARAVSASGNHPLTLW